MSRVQSYQGLCIGGPMDRRRVACAQKTYRYAETNTDMDFSVQPIGINPVAVIKQHAYQWMPIYVDEEGFGVFIHESLNQVEALRAILTAYEDQNNRLVVLNDKEEFIGFELILENDARESPMSRMVSIMAHRIVNAVIERGLFRLDVVLKGEHPKTLETRMAVVVMTPLDPPPAPPYKVQF